MKFLRPTAHVVSILIAFGIYSSGITLQAQRAEVGGPQRVDPQRGGRTTENISAGDPHGSNRSFVLRRQVAQKTDEETANEKTEKQERTIDRQYARNGVVATIITGFLTLLVLGTQLTLLDKQRKLMHRQTKLMNESLTETRKATKAAILAVEYADRPWIRVYLTPETLVASDTEGLQITCLVTVKNIGKSVAEHVMTWDYLAVHPGTLREEQEKLRAFFDRPEVLTIGAMTIFPDEEKTVRHTVGTRKEVPDEYWRNWMPDMLNRDLADRILPLTYIGCVGYRYGTSDKWHFTYWGRDLVLANGAHLPLHIATGRQPQPPHLRECLIGNLDRAT